MTLDRPLLAYCRIDRNTLTWVDPFQWILSRSSWISWAFITIRVQFMSKIIHLYNSINILPHPVLSSAGGRPGEQDGRAQIGTFIEAFISDHLRGQTMASQDLPHLERDGF